MAMIQTHMKEEIFNGRQLVAHLQSMRTKSLKFLCNKNTFSLCNIPSFHITALCDKQTNIFKLSYTKKKVLTPPLANVKISPSVLHGRRKKSWRLGMT